MNDATADTLYHYCRNEDFLSIIEKQELWLSQLTSSNAPSEGRVAYQALERAIEQTEGFPNNVRQEVISHLKKAFPRERKKQLIFLQSMARVYQKPVTYRVNGKTMRVAPLDSPSGLTKLTLSNGKPRAAKWPATH